MANTNNSFTSQNPNSRSWSGVLHITFTVPLCAVIIWPWTDRGFPTIFLWRTPSNNACCLCCQTVCFDFRSPIKIARSVIDSCQLTLCVLFVVSCYFVGALFAVIVWLLSVDCWFLDLFVWFACTLLPIDLLLVFGCFLLLVVYSVFWHMLNAVDDCNWIVVSCCCSLVTVGRMLWIQVCTVWNPGKAMARASISA